MGKVMEWKIHPTVVFFTGDNYASWAKGIITYCRWIKLLPNIYRPIPKPNSEFKKLAWCDRNMHIRGLISYSFGPSFFSEVDSKLEGIKCLRTCWLIIWEHFGDPHVPPLPKDLVADCLLPLDDVDSIPYDEHTLWKIQTFVDFES